MNCYFLKKHTNTLIEQTKTTPQETLEFELNQQMETFSISPPINLSGDGKRFLVVILFEATNTVFNKTDENKRFSI